MFSFYVRKKFLLAADCRSFELLFWKPVYCLKRSEDLDEKIIFPVIFDTNRSFKR